MSAVTEYEVEKNLLIKLDTQLGYHFIEIKDYSGVVDNFRSQFCIFNSAQLLEKKGTTSLSDSEFSRVLNRLENHSIYESAKILREKWVLQLDNGKTAYVDFFSEDPNRNIFQVTHQVTMDPEHKDDVLYKNRYDVTVLINGLPLVQIELKRPGIEINEAINQINRYRRYSFRGLFRFIQVFVVSNSTRTKYFANVNENYPDGSEQNILKSLCFYWTDSENKRINALDNFADAFLPTFQLTQILSKFFVIKQTEPTLIVMRPYQIFAVKLAYERVIGSNMNGFVFHTTGSGKTLTSFKLATLLRDDKSIDKVFFLIDRKDLDDQTVDEYNAFEKDCVDETDSTKELVESIPEKKLIITTIQKMAAALRIEKYQEKMAPYRDKKVVFIIDECHRSQFGKMHGDVKKHFINADFIGFTGTPIFAENRSPDGRTTADVFNAGPNVDPCIHRYMIKEAIADGNVLRFSVEYWRTIWAHKISEAGIDPEKLDDPDYCRVHNIDMDGLYHDPERMKEVSDNILSGLDNHTHPAGKDVYTAIFAIDHIPQLMWYYRYLKSHNQKGYKIAAIFHYIPNEDMEEEPDEHARENLKECITDYNAMFGTDFDLNTFDSYRKDISKRMKQRSLPQIDLLLVVDMFLTGFDSKATNTLFLDKNMVWHSLVQAYSRTNRVDKLTKQFGQIVTYRNIKRWQDDALKLYSGDGNPSDYLLESYDFYVKQWAERANALKQIAPTPDDAGYIQSEDEQKAFVIAFRQLTNTLATLKTFSKFDWADLDVFMTEENYFDYKSWYLAFFDQMEKEKKEGKKTVLADVDFAMELVRTDKVNVVYILNLLKGVNRKDPALMNEAVDLIMREIERSDNQKLRYKKEMMEAFIRTRFFQLDPDADIVEAYNEYEKERLQASVEEFSKANGINGELVMDFVSKYFANEKSLTKEEIREHVAPLHLGLLKSTKLINKILAFVEMMFDQFTTEEE